MSSLFRYIASLVALAACSSAAQADEGRESLSSTSRPPRLVLLIDAKCEQIWLSRAQALERFGAIKRLSVPSQDDEPISPRRLQALFDEGSHREAGPTALIARSDSAIRELFDNLPQRAEGQARLITLPADPHDLATVLSLLETYHEFFGNRPGSQTPPRPAEPAVHLTLGDL